MTDTAAKYLTDQAAAIAGSYTVAEWCLRRKISHASFYNMLRAGSGPRCFKIGNKTFVSAEADTAWVKQREAEFAREHGALSSVLVERARKRSADGTGVAAPDQANPKA